VLRRRSNADVRTADFWTLGASRLGRGTLELLVNGVGREQGVPGLTLLPTRSARMWTHRSLMSARMRAPCGEGDGCVLTATSAVLLARSELDDPERELAAGSARIDTAGRRGEQSLSARIDVGNAVTLTPLVRAALEQLAIDGASGPGHDSSRVFTRGALGAEWRATQWVTLRAMGSAECNGTSEQQPRFCSGVEPSGRLGLQLGRGALVALANAGRYVRVPTLGELYGMSALVRGNAELVAEHGTSLEAGVRWTAGRWGPVRGAFADLFAFSRDADDLVAWRRSSMGFVRPYNVGRARISGVEWLGALEAFELVRLELAATLLDPRDTTPGRTVSNDILPFRSRLVLAPMVQLRTRALRPAGLDTAMLGARYVHQSSRYADDAGLVVIPEQGTLDLEAEVKVLREKLAVRGRLANVLDQRRFDLIGYALSGRAVYGTLEAAW
jgi:iron complex outermembrane receptor protein